jgi:hypothetical protein
MHRFPTRFALVGACLLPLLFWNCAEDGGEDPPRPTSRWTYPLGFVGADYVYDEAYIGADWPLTVDTLFHNPGWMEISIVGGSRIRLAGRPDAAGVDSVHVRMRDGADEWHAVVLRVEVRPANSIALTGDWRLSVDVTQAFGEVCAGEENEAVVPYPVFLDQSGSWVVIAGLAGVFGQTLGGHLYPSGRSQARLLVSGSYPEDGGQTRAEYRLELFAADSLAGEEIWSWDDTAGNACSGASTVTLRRIW